MNLEIKSDGDMFNEIIYEQHLTCGIYSYWKVAKTKLLIKCHKNNCG